MVLDPQIALGLHRQMLRAAAAERRILELMESGEALVLYHSARGQEAVAAGAVSALVPTDALFYGHRGVGQLLAKGVDPVGIFGDVLANTAGSTGGLGAGIVHVVDPDRGVYGQSGTVGGTFPLAAGVALAAQYRGDDRVVLCMFGDGTANRGTFHEAANAAGVWRLPVIWLCENNGYSVSLAQHRSTPVDDLAVRAAGYGMPGVVVDGQDVHAVYGAVSAAVDRARAGDGPTFVEAKTLRFRGHFEGDPQQYRPDGERQQVLERDPIAISAERLLADGVVTASGLEQIESDIESEMSTALATARSAPLPPRSRAFEGVLA